MSNVVPPVQPTDAPTPPRHPLRTAGCWIAAALGGQRARPIIILAGSLWLVFGLFRVVLYLAYRHTLADVAPIDVARCFLFGLRFDAVPIGVMLFPIVLILTLAPNAAFRYRAFRIAVSFTTSTILFVVLFVEIVGLLFFLNYAVRLNWVAIGYFRDPREVITYIWSAYPVIVLILTPLLIWVGMVSLSHWALWRGPAPQGRFWPRPFAAAGLSLLCFLAARGSIDHHPLRFGPAYFTNNQTLAQLTLNNFFTMADAVKCARADQQAIINRLNLPSLEEALPVTRRILTESDNPNLYPEFENLPDLSDYNVVVILMEGVGGRLVGSMGAERPATPRLDAIAEQGLFFDHLYATGSRTCRGIVGVLCAHPDLTPVSLIKRSRAQGRTPTLPKYLHSRGYRTLMFYGGDPDFDNMKGFLGADGMETFYGQGSMPSGPTSTWGCHDEVTLTKANEVLSEMGDQKFFAFILTVSNHENWKVPKRCESYEGKDLETKKLNACLYADWALGEFFEEAATKPWFKKTIFVIVSDHGRKIDPTRLLDVAGHRIPCIFYAPGVIPAKRISTVCSQVDIAPTLLGLMGLPKEPKFFGRNLLRVSPTDGFAFMEDDEQFAFVRGEKAVVDVHERGPVLYRMGPKLAEQTMVKHPNPEQVERLRDEMLSYYRVAEEAYFTGWELPEVQHEQDDTEEDHPPAPVEKEP